MKRRWLDFVLTHDMYMIRKLEIRWSDKPP